MLLPHGVGIPVPVPSEVSAPFWEACARAELVYQRCGDCGCAVFHPAPRCRACLSPNLVWLASAGRGSIYSWTVAWRAQQPAFRVPYATAIVDMDEGYQMLANVIGCDTDDLVSGLRVRVEFHDIGSGMKMAYFRPGDVSA